MFFRPSPEARRHIKLPMGALMRQGRLSIRTDLQDNHLYVLDRSVLATLQAKPSLSDIKQVEATLYLNTHAIFMPNQCRNKMSQLGCLLKHMVIMQILL